MGRIFPHSEYYFDYSPDHAVIAPGRIRTLFKTVLHVKNGAKMHKPALYRCWIAGKYREYTLELRADVLTETQIRSIFDSMRILAPRPADYGNRKLFGKDEPVSVLILGNSFVASSDIGQALTALASTTGKKIEVRAVSVGMATAATFTSPPYAELVAGGFDVIFQCGIWSQSDKIALYDIRSAMPEKTRLVLFPAHNENWSQILDAAQTHNLICVEWKQVLEDLTDEGYNDLLCYVDGVSHTTPLGGYAGALLIFAHLYGEVPEIPQSLYDEAFAATPGLPAFQRPIIAEQIAETVRSYR